MTTGNYRTSRRLIMSCCSWWYRCLRQWSVGLNRCNHPPITDEILCWQWLRVWNPCFSVFLMQNYITYAPISNKMSPDRTYKLPNDRLDNQRFCSRLRRLKSKLRPITSREHAKKNSEWFTERHVNKVSTHSLTFWPWNVRESWLNIHEKNPNFSCTWYYSRRSVLFIL